MIARLTGRLDAIDEATCVIDVGGVGYLVHASTRTLAALPRPPEIARVLVETQVREDSLTLFGFADGAERDWFRLLVTVQGVGAKVALGILSALGPAELAAAIAAGDRARLTRAPGVGAKLAARLLTELRERAGGMPLGEGALAGVSFGQPPPRGLAEDALSALVNLGYRRPEAHPVVARIVERLGDDAALDRVIRDSLQELAR